MIKSLSVKLNLILVISLVSINAAGQLGRRLIVSPEIKKDKTIIFRYQAPNAVKLELSAQFLKERQLMKKDTAGLWSVTVGPVTPDIYPYSFFVDGIQVNDPNNTLIFPNERFKSSLVDIPGDTPLIHSMQDVPHGKVTYRYYMSGSLDLIRPLVIYTPPGYDKDSKVKYPVLYLIHGMTDTEETWFKVGHVNLILDNLIFQGKAKPMIIVMPYANPLPALQEKNSSTDMNVLNTDYFSNDMIKDIVPFIESNYRVLADSFDRGIAGFSLGGRQTLAIGLANPQMFSWVCALSPAIWKNEFDNNFKQLYASPETLNKQLKMLWISCGKEDGLYASASDFIQALKDRNIRYKEFFPGGGHTWMNCRLFISTVSPLLFKK
jgi:enterochelin esterase family protein